MARMPVDLESHLLAQMLNSSLAEAVQRPSRASVNDHDGPLHAVGGTPSQIRTPLIFDHHQSRESHISTCVIYVAIFEAA